MPTPNNIPEPKIFMLNYRENGELKSVLQYNDRFEVTKHRKNCPCWLLTMFGYILFSILIILAAALYASFAPRSAFYSENCTTRSCLKGLNLTCINGTCLCKSNQYYLKGCFSKLNYLQKCHGNSYCTNLKNLVCLDGVCKCNSSSYWNGTTCLVQIEYGKSCSFSNQCLVGKEMICDTTLKVCSCNTNNRYSEYLFEQKTLFFY
jgi:hypothetical protein